MKEEESRRWRSFSPTLSPFFLSARHAVGRPGVPQVDNPQWGWGGVLAPPPTPSLFTSLSHSLSASKTLPLSCFTLGRNRTSPGRALGQPWWGRVGSITHPMGVEVQEGVIAQQIGDGYASIQASNRQNSSSQNIAKIRQSRQGEKLAFHSLSNSSWFMIRTDFI